MKNKWKYAFWTCVFILGFTNLFWFYQIIDQGVTITYMKDGYSDTENDLEILMEIINSTDLTKKEIKNNVANLKALDFKSDTIELNSVHLIFENRELKKIERHQ